MFFGLLLLLYKSNTFRGKGSSSSTRSHKANHDHTHNTIFRENATLVMLVRYCVLPVVRFVLSIGTENYQRRCDQ